MYLPPHVPLNASKYMECCNNENAINLGCWERCGNLIVMNPPLAGTYKISIPEYGICREISYNIGDTIEIDLSVLNIPSNRKIFFTVTAPDGTDYCYSFTIINCSFV